MNKEKIYALIEVTNHEARLAVGESYKTRFDILRMEKTPMQGIKRQRIVDEQNVMNGITKARKQTGDAFGYHVERALAAVSSVNAQRHNKKVNVVPGANSKRIRLGSIQRELNEAVGFKSGPQLELVNIDYVKCITNGVASREMPVGETAEVLIMNVGLLYADKEVVYAYVHCIKKVGLEILDVYLNSYIIANEVAVFGQIVDRYVIQIGLARNHTTLSLSTHGKLMNCEVIEDGYRAWLQGLIEQYHLSGNVSYRLAQNTCTFGTDSVEDQIIYIWSKSGEQGQISERQACGVTVPYMEGWLNMINEACTPIIESGDMCYLLNEEGCRIPSLQKLLCYLNIPARIYISQAIGVRGCSYVTYLSLSYSWREQMAICRDERVCCNPQKVEEIMDTVTKKNSVDEEGGFTGRLKSILLSDK